MCMSNQQVSLWCVFVDAPGSLHTFPQNGSRMSQAFQDWVKHIKLRVHVCTCSFVKVGAMVFLCHDINDIFMEGAKMARYADPWVAANRAVCGFHAVLVCIAHLLLPSVRHPLSLL